MGVRGWSSTYSDEGGSGDGSVGEGVQLQKIVITIKNLPASESERLYASIDVVLLHPFRCCKALPFSPVRLIHVVAMDNIELYEAIFDQWVAGDRDPGI